MVIELRVTGLKKNKFLYLLDLFVGMGEKGPCNLVCVVPLNDWANAGLYVSVVLIFWVVGPILRDGCRI